MKKVAQNLVLSHTLLNKLRGFRHVVNRGNILNSDGSAAIFVHHREGLQDHVLSARGQLVPKNVYN